MDLKYPRTFHIPGSPGTQSDDRILSENEWQTGLAGQPVVATEKMDGENTTITKNSTYARSLDSGYHESRSYIKSTFGRIRTAIPPGWRICGENMYAVHSIEYTDLEDWFLVFAMFDANNILLDWNTTVELCSDWELATVPVLGEYTTGAEAVLDCAGFDTATQEGFVIRTPDAIAWTGFSTNVLKWVREKHVTTGDHWMYQEIRRNGRL